MKTSHIVLLTVYFTFFAWEIVGENALANDDLYLCGVVKNVNTQERKVLVEVTSEICTGDTIFDVSREVQFDQFVIGESKCFMIDTNVCPQEQIATIVEH